MEFKPVFNSVSETEYLIKDKNTIEFFKEKVNKTIEVISIIEVDKYSDVMNTVLYKTILSRLISGYFVKYHKNIIDKLPFITVLIEIENKTFRFSLGRLVTEDINEGYIHGSINV